ncbi:type IV pilus assembly protein PilM [Candidatus Saccharibacteria bacterium]|nr:type IV pilus assembly protein PilM [Candidatus Saccharibacteria bacterium]
MSILSGVSEFFGLDIGTSLLRAVQLSGYGPVKALNKYGSVGISGNISVSDAKADQLKLADAIRSLVKDAGITTKNVAVGIPSNRVFTTVVDMERLSPAELAKTIKYQADSIIPTPLAESKIDWAPLGDSPKDPSKVEVLLSSVNNAYIESRLDMLEGAGFNVVAFEPDTFALVRSLIATDVAAPQMVLDIGTVSTDLVIAVKGAPRLTRSIPVGADTILKAAVHGLNIDPAQAAQFLYKFGLSKAKLEGQVYNAIISTIDNLTSEIEKSIKFFQTRYPNIIIDRIIVTGGASTLPEFPLHIANKFGINVEIGNSWRNITFPSGKQDELLSVSNHFAVAAGLAERST